MVQRSRVEQNGRTTTSIHEQWEVLAQVHKSCSIEAVTDAYHLAQQLHHELQLEQESYTSLFPKKLSNGLYQIGGLYCNQTMIEEIFSKFESFVRESTKQEFKTSRGIENLEFTRDVHTIYLDVSTRSNDMYIVYPINYRLSSGVVELHTSISDIIFIVSGHSVR